VILEAVGRVNKERLQQLLYEIQHEDTEGRYAAILRRETLTGTSGTYIRGGGRTSLQVSSATLPSNLPPHNKMVPSRLFGYVAEHWDYLGIIAAGFIAPPSAQIWLLMLQL